MALTRAYHGLVNRMNGNTYYIWENKQRKFTIGKGVVARLEYRRPYRLCVDYAEDFLVLKYIYDALYHEGDVISVLSAFAFLDSHPEIALLNREYIQKS